MKPLKKVLHTLRTTKTQLTYKNLPKNWEEDVALLKSLETKME